MNMIILPTTGMTFNEYLASLSESARENWTYVRKHNLHTGYQEIGFNKALIEKFMAMWEEQPIRGEKRKWAFGIDHLERLDKAGDLRVFISYDTADDDVKALHFIQRHDGGYYECHPPLWEKTPENQRRYLAKFMWFHLIKFALKDPDIKYLDFGGGRDDSWREMIKHRAEYPNPAYKWMYIPDSVKKHPDEQPDYVLLGVGGCRRLEEI